MSGPGPNPYEVVGVRGYGAPWHLEPAWLIVRYGQVIASIYAIDGDDEMARRRAVVMAHALWEGEDDG